MTCRAFTFLAALFLTVMTLVPMARADAAKDACNQIRVACKDAGFSAGDAAKGNRIGRDCVDPLLKGKDSVKRAVRDLPQVDASVIATCAGGGKKSAKAGKGGKAAKTVTAAAAAAPAQPAPLPPGAEPGPNFVLVLVDDFSMNLLTTDQNILADSMPNLVRMMAEGATFENYFVTESLCCPSRATLLTGQMPHNTGVLTNSPPNGGYEAFMANGNAGETFAVTLHQQFYRTALMGKYLNGYQPDQHPVPPGWSDWAVGGGAYKQFDSLLNQNGELVTHADYLTDVLSGLGTDFIRDAAGGPFFLKLSTYAPHAPFTPPARYENLFPDLTYPETPAFGARPDAAAPAWLQVIKPLDKRDITRITEVFRKRVQSAKAIDDMIGDVRATLDDLGLTDATYVMFMSDNGFHLGEYSLKLGKMTPFDTDIHVPFVITGPGIAAGRSIPEIVMNTDIAPTLAELAGAKVPATVDGRSLAGLLRGDGGPWRGMAVVEHLKESFDADDPDAPADGKGIPPTYTALRMQDALYVEYETGEVGYYDLAADPYALRNVADSLPAARRDALHAAIVANRTCVGAGACWAAQSLVP